VVVVTGPEPLVLRTTGPEDTRAVAAAIACVCRPGDILLLAGDLGAGKTTFAQGFGRGLGVAEALTSPTFTLMREHPVEGSGPIGTLLHADLWRLDHLQEVVDLGLPELVGEESVALVEWGDAAAPLFGPSVLLVSMEPGSAEDDRLRLISLRSSDPGWATRWRSLTGLVGRWRPTP
jgi:tRNA threonylcarbamoyladenosine biosynthesis protein TsaE